MHEELMTLHTLELISESIEEVRKRSLHINSPDDFLLSYEGQYF